MNNLSLGATLACLAVSLPAFAAPPGTDVFAIVITNNRSHNLERPDLQYADDDGARYHALFRGVAPAEHVFLMTTFDHASAATYPALARGVRAPTRDSLRGVVRDVAAATAASRRAGRRSEVYFVFAGHGDVDNGRGFLELEDARIDGHFLETEVVERVGGDVQHLILDSCNSFFVLNPRRPGGRRWATPKDLAMGFAQRHPQVGLFLSTNAEAEVYEWSEFESGIFSHEVRSGLSGAADVDHDGFVSYLEMASFVDRANERLPREGLRPHVFHRGPAGQNEARLFASASLTGRRLSVGDEARRLWVRSADGKRLLDLHKEPGPLNIVLPGDTDAGFSVIEWKPSQEPNGRPTLTEYEFSPGATLIALDAAQPHAAQATARGAAALFSQLFAAPFGPAAHQSFLSAQKANPEAVYGIGSADETRMRHYLTAVADSDRSRRELSAVGAGILGMTAVGVAGYSWFFDGGLSTPLSVGLGVLGGLSLAGGLWQALTLSPGELALSNFESAIRVPGASRASVVPKAEIQLEELAKRDRRIRFAAVGVFGLWAGWMAAGGINEAGWGGPDNRRNKGEMYAWFGSSALLAITAAFLSQMETPGDRLLRLYRQDPDRNRKSSLNFGFAPTPGGMGLTIGGKM